MGYIEETLLHGDSIAYQTKLHWINFSRSVLFGILGAGVVLPGISSNAPGITKIGGAFLSITVFLAIRAPFIHSGGEFVVTKMRILLKVGNPRRRSVESVELMLDKVESLTVYQPFTGRLMGYGSVIIRGTGGTSERFDLITTPFEFRRQALQQLRYRRTPIDA